MMTAERDQGDSSEGPFNLINDMNIMERRWLVFFHVCCAKPSSFMLVLLTLRNAPPTSRAVINDRLGDGKST